MRHCGKHSLECLPLEQYGGFQRAGLSEYVFKDNIETVYLVTYSSVNRCFLAVTFKGNDECNLT